MLKKKVIIADDDQDARSLLKEYLSDYPEFEIISECAHGFETIAKIDQLEPDIVFLDIQMPGMNGFQVIQHIVHQPRIIFSTAFDKYALKAFDHNAIDYLLKPYSFERFSQAIGKIRVSDSTGNENNKHIKDFLSTSNDYPECFFVEYGNKFVSIKIDEVTWLEAEGNYTRIYTNDGGYLSSFGISQLGNKLPSNKFLRIHRSSIINVNYVQEVYKDPAGPIVKLKNGKALKVSRGYNEALKRLIY
jgi:two-component system LytT family response regulator